VEYGIQPFIFKKLLEQISIFSGQTSATCNYWYVSKW